ncbi:FRRS1 [Branchiostoma lanceolatum]|uniref:FRRS1 protein n=1 Tax=Branchiostoma lanceolatum TaxID=7740 RepID=A0A8K0E8B9_BRALA|nr:FRRS1 [Branchiostoma lanceolatum]
MWRVILTLLVITPVVWAYPSGAPTVACVNMFPNHGASEQTSPPPYELVVNKDTYAGGEEIEVTLRRTAVNSPSFKGFFIQARTVDGSADALGKFTTFDPSTKTVNCGSVANSENAVTHTNPSGKTSVTVTWTAPANSLGDIQFRCGLAWFNGRTLLLTAGGETPLFLSGWRKNCIEKPPVPSHPPDNMKLLVVAVFLSLAAYAAGQTMINCFQCKAGTFDSGISLLTGTNKCLRDANNPNSTVQTVTCPVTSKCFTKINTIAKYAHAVERGCWSDDDCDEEMDDDCNGLTKTGTCLKCCSTDRHVITCYMCNKDFAQLDGVLNGVTGLHQLSVLALLPVAVAMLF